MMADDEVIARHTDALALLNRRDNTIAQRRYALGRLARSLDGTPLLAATVEQLVEHLARPTLSPEGRATETSHVRAFYGWAVDADLIARSPAANLRRPRLPRRLPRPIDPADLTRAIREAPDRIRPWLYLAGYAGLRAMEIAALRAEDVLLHYDPPMLLVIDGKGGRQRLVPIADELAAEMRTWAIPASGWLFARRDGQPGPTPAHMVSQLVNEHLRALGINATCHQGRHLFGTSVYRASRDLRITQEVMGHASPATTAGYAAWDPERAAAAIKGLHYAPDSDET